MTLSPAQRAFLAFHTQPPEAWRWHFLGTQLRASRAGGATVTIWRDDVEHLVALGLLCWGVGSADVVLTQRGREALAALSETESQDA